MKTQPLRLTVLGSGTSMGVPTLSCHCAVCESTDPRDKRLRPSVLLTRGEKNVVIDTTPDFRTQALRARIDRLDAVLLTHGHADHILGFDDMRPYNIRQATAMPVYGNQETFRVVRRAFSYVFDNKPTLSSIPSVTLHDVKGPFVLLGMPFIPVPLLHGEMDVLGFRFGRAAYLTDFSRLPESSLPLLDDLDDLIVDALRDVPHPMHQTVEQALELIDKLKPQRAWFTHIAHDLPHAATNERLKKAGYPHVQLAYDGLQFDVATESPEKEVHSSQLTVHGFGEEKPRRKANPREDRAHPSHKTHAEKAARAPAAQVSLPAGKLTVFTSAEDWAAKYGGRRSSQFTVDSSRFRRRETQDPPSQTEDGAPENQDRKTGGRGSVIAIGTFDGIHLGHQRILEFTLTMAKETGAVATALTFEPPPLKVLRPDAAPLRISTNQQRMEWFGALGMEAAVVLPFTTDMAQLSPEDFVEQILVQRLQVKAVVVGDNFRFGHRQAGDVKYLRELGMRHGFSVVVHTPVVIDGQIVSSTLIRKEVAEGNVTAAARLLGRPFALTGEVTSGTGTGGKLLFPTLNLKVEQELLPARGVYITRTVLEGEPSSHRSVTNIGMRPTFNGGGLTVETHLLDYSGTFSPKRIEVRFWKRLRDEKKFRGPEELKEQIAKDIAMANTFFSRLRRLRSKGTTVGD